MTPTVIGLDLSLTATGLAFADGSTETIRTKLARGDQRLVDITDRIAATIEVEQPHLVVVEDLPVHAKSAGITGMVHGAVRTVLLRSGTPYALLSPATLKAFATGKGNVDKTAMTLAAYKRSGREFGDDNQCDAWWLRLAGLEWLGAPEFAMPQAQRDRLAKGQWPEVTR